MTAVVTLESAEAAISYVSACNTASRESEAYRMLVEVPVKEQPGRDDIRRIFTSHGFTVKEGQEDLKEYVYQAATSLLSFAGLGAVLPVDSDGLEWAQPTSVAHRLGDAVTLLCAGNRPPNEIVEAWLAPDSEDMRLQEFCISYGPAWAQGIVCIDAAMVLADGPTEGVEHAQRVNISDLCNKIRYAENDAREAETALSAEDCIDVICGTYQGPQ